MPSEGVYRCLNERIRILTTFLYMILGIKEVSWKSAKGMMSEANFLKSLTEMDVDAITAKQSATVKGMCSQ